MSIERLQPYAGSHAVQHAIFVVEWAEPLRSDAILDMIKLATKFRNLGLSNVEQQSAVQFNFTTDQAKGTHPQVSSSHEVGGVVFSMPPTSTGQGRSITISRQSCMVFVPDYSRWAQVWSDVKNYFDIALEVISPLRPLTVVALQYTDSFQWKDDPSDLPLQEIFRRDTLLPPSVFSRTGLWHCHQGYMQIYQLPVAHKRLENVNIDMLDTGGLRSIQITGAHRATLDQPLWQANKKNQPVLVKLFEDMHLGNKVLLEQLLTEEACAKIGLNPGEEAI
jgi:uncharacterized protein (TIGR04255 family)